MECDSQPTKKYKLRLFRTPTTKVVYNLRSKVGTVEVTQRRSRSNTPMSFSPSTPARRTPENSPGLTPSSAKRLGVDLSQYSFDKDSNLMKTPTRTVTSRDTPPCRPSKKRFKVFLNKGKKARRSMGPIIFASSLKPADSPGSQLTRIMQSCTIRTSSPRLRRLSPSAGPTPKKNSGKRSNRVLHSVRSKITK